MFETHLSIDQGSFLVPAMVITVLGLIVGSFLNVVIYRLPKMSASDDATALQDGLNNGEPTPRINLWWPNSQCPHCHAPIPPWFNVPLLGYVYLKGVSACCYAPIPPRYPLVEALGGGAALILYMLYGETPGALWLYAFFCAAIVCSCIELTTATKATRPAYLAGTKLAYLLIGTGLAIALLDMLLDKYSDGLAIGLTTMREAVLCLAIAWLLLTAVRMRGQEQSSFGNHAFLHLLPVGVCLGLQALAIALTGLLAFRLVCWVALPRNVGLPNLGQQQPANQDSTNQSNTPEQRYAMDAFSTSVVYAGASLSIMLGSLVPVWP